MNKYIVITSISYPTEAVYHFAEMPDYKLIVVGDKKNPAFCRIGVVNNN
jgi:hypothetical protein